MNLVKLNKHENYPAIQLSFCRFQIHQKNIILPHLFQTILIEAPLGAEHDPHHEPPPLHRGASQHPHVHEQRQLRAGAGGHQETAQVMESVA